MNTALWYQEQNLSFVTSNAAFLFFFSFVFKGVTRIISDLK